MQSIYLKEMCWVVRACRGQSRLVHHYGAEAACPYHHFRLEMACITSLLLGLLLLPASGTSTARGKLCCSENVKTVPWVIKNVAVQPLQS